MEHYFMFRSILYNIVNYTQSESESIVLREPLVDGVFTKKKKNKKCKIDVNFS